VSGCRQDIVTLRQLEIDESTIGHASGNANILSDLVFMSNNDVIGHLGMAVLYKESLYKWFITNLCCVLFTQHKFVINNINNT